jgi:hypothetical protein
MSQELSNNQRSGTPADNESKPPVVQQTTKLPSGDSVKKAPKQQGMPAIDKRVKVEHLLPFLQESVQNSVDARSIWQDQLEDWYLQYRGIVDEKDFPWEGCSNLHIPITGILVDTLVSRMINPIFSTQPFVTAKGASSAGATPAIQPNGGQPPVTGSDHDKARDVENMLHYVMNQRIGVYPKVQDWIRESFIYGRGVMKVIWRKEIRKYTRHLSQSDVMKDVQVAQQEVQSGAPTTETLEFLDQMAFYADNHDWVKHPFLEMQREEVVYNNPDWMFIPIEDFIYHPRALDIQSSPYVAHRFRRDIDTLLKEQDLGVYTNVDLIPAGIGNDSSEIVSSHGEKLLDDVQTLEEGYENISHEAAETLEDLELIEWHGKYDIDGDGRMEDIVATFAPGANVLLSVRESDLMHGKKPFAEIKPFPVPGRFEAQGVPELITDLQQEINDIHNMRIDSGTITNAVMWWFDPNSDIDPEIHRPGPGMGFPAGPNQFGVVQTGDVKHSSFKEEELVRRLIQDRIGVSDFAIGNDSTAVANKTATGISAIVNEGNQRLEMMLRNISTGINEAVLQTFQLIQQFGDDEVLFRAVEDASGTLHKVNARDIAGQWDIELSANTVNTNRMIKLQEIQQQLELALRAGPEYIDVAPLLKEFFRKSGSKQTNEIVRNQLDTVMEQATKNPELLVMLKQKVDELAVQAGMTPPEGQPGAEGAPPVPPAPQASPQGQPPAGGIDLQGIIQQLGPVIQQLFSGGGGGQPPQQPPLQ